MVETDPDEFSKICKKDWKLSEQNPSILSHLEKGEGEGRKDRWEFLMISKKKIIHQTNERATEINIEKVKRLESFKKFAKKNSIEI